MCSRGELRQGGVHYFAAVKGLLTEDRGCHPLYAVDAD